MYLLLIVLDILELWLNNSVNKVIDRIPVDI